MTDTDRDGTLQLGETAQRALRLELDGDAHSGERRSVGDYHGDIPKTPEGGEG